MVNKFTKGKWESVEHLYNGSYEVTDIHSGEHICYLRQGVYNAHLIAAAPQMYKALDDLANGRGVDFPIEQLLAKARGE
jgi:hypothetical protein